MTNEEKIDIMREGWSEAISALGKCRIFLTALHDYEWLGKQKNQIHELLEDVNHASETAERDFRPEIINP